MEEPILYDPSEDWPTGYDPEELEEYLDSISNNNKN